MRRVPEAPQKAAKAERKARLADLHRQQITAAAARCFANSGYDATTVRAIAEASGFTASSLYTYFTGKEEIFEAIIAQVTEASMAVFSRTLPRNLTMEQKIEFLFLRLLEFAEEHRDAIVFLVSVPHADGVCEGGSESQLRREIAFISAFERWIATHTTADELGDHNPKDVSFFVWGVMHGFFVQWLSSGTSTKLADKVPVMTNLILNGLRP